MSNMNPRHWYIDDCADDVDSVEIYDGADFGIFTICSREVDEEDGVVIMEGFRAKDIALLILKAVGAEKPIDG